MEKNIRFEELKYLLENLYACNQIPFHMCNAKDEIIMQAGEKNHDKDPFYTDTELVKKLREQSRESAYPVLEIEDAIFIYGVFCDALENCYIYGPISLENPSLSKLFEYRKRHGITGKDFSILHESFMQLVNILAVALFMVTGRMIDKKMIIAQNEGSLSDSLIGEREVNQYKFEKAEFDMEHLSYQYEQQYLTAVENGDVEFFKNTLLDEPKALEKVGLLAKDSKKQIEYMCVSSTVLVSRASIRGGLNPSIAYALSELYLQKLENCKNTREILNLHRTMQLDFVTKIRELKEQKRKEDYIEACKDYIYQRVHYPVRIKEIADMLGMNHSYLSKKFKEKEGMTIVQYSIDAKLQAAANMLKYSDASIAEITDYFCFVSQSRFGSQFKQKYGVTPMVYRKENRVIDFTENNKNVHKSKK
ncbi:helix-turn-helix domain-containing protein [Anaerobium acetethylicum]|uniref:AraC-type DNA-binding protein n=1 Tax=Anaerobium acetethylicum TaxID=1619234 RepID=A0A1D3TNF3_9FIRM|nr:AraC family transcriptional regulator [Anaerobium acetethylicum]SCP94852.1 AraC-type DNA-binding protein [Anaerobium acetethylicum]